MQHDSNRDLARYSVVAFFVLAMVLGAGTVCLVVQGILPAGVALASALSASVAGVIMTAAEDGRAGLKLMLTRLLMWRVGIGYWLFALLFLVPAILFGSEGVSGGRGGNADAPAALVHLLYLDL